jgi:hypothetical protein
MLPNCRVLALLGQIRIVRMEVEVPHAISHRRFREIIEQLLSCQVLRSLTFCFDRVTNTQALDQIKEFPGFEHTVGSSHPAMGFEVSIKGDDLRQLSFADVHKVLTM